MAVVARNGRRVVGGTANGGNRYMRSVVVVKQGRDSQLVVTLDCQVLRN